MPKVCVGRTCVACSTESKLCRWRVTSKGQYYSRSRRLTWAPSWELRYAQVVLVQHLLPHGSHTTPEIVHGRDRPSNSRPLVNFALLPANSTFNEVCSTLRTAPLNRHLSAGQTNTNIAFTRSKEASTQTYNSHNVGQVDSVYNATYGQHGPTLTVTVSPSLTATSASRRYESSSLAYTIPRRLTRL